MFHFSSAFVLALALVGCSVSRARAAVCTSSTNTYTMKVNLFAGELGYITFEECGDEVNPTIGLKRGAVYTFDQTDVSNYYHPIGFSYFADGAHNDADELEPGISQGYTGCESTLTCPAPMYFKNGAYIGTYSNIAPADAPSGLTTPAVTTGLEDFGLDNYEPQFFYPIGDWLDLQDFKVLLKYDDTTYNGDLFYFCHIHQFMAGRIKILDETTGDVINDGVDTPELGFTYDAPGTFDDTCGTFGLDTYVLPNEQCPVEFVCGVDGGDAQYASCVDAMNCAMTAGMTTKYSSKNASALFLYQMIPHHQNAVNMAKSLLKLHPPNCASLSDETDLCALEVILREIINNQNAQIQTMKNILDSWGLAETDDCEVQITSLSSDTCFSASTTVQVLDQGTVSIEDLNVGDLVYAGIDPVTNKPKYQSVDSLGHTSSVAYGNFLQIYTTNSTRPLEVTGDHLLFVVNASKGQTNTVRADRVKVGDSLTADQVGVAWTVTKIDSTMKQGLYLPLTIDGTIVVNGGIKASAYVSIEGQAQGFVSTSASYGFSEQTISHWWLSPFRLLCLGVSSTFCGDTDADRDAVGILNYLAYGRDFAALFSGSANVLLHLLVLPLTTVFGTSVIFESVFGAALAPAALALMGLGLCWAIEKRRGVLQYANMMGVKQA